MRGISAGNTDDELYVYDQCCRNCRYYCDWDSPEENGCKLYGRPDYEQYPENSWCFDWKGRSHAGKCN